MQEEFLRRYPYTEETNRNYSHTLHLIFIRKYYISSTLHLLTAARLLFEYGCSMKYKKKKVLILFSGGIDSTACIHYYKSKGFVIETSFIDFGQLSCRRELSATKRVLSFYKLKTNIVRVKGNQEFRDGEISFRNIFLISAALVNKKNYQGLVCLGIHAGTDYVDCSPAFVKVTQGLLDLYYNGSVLLDTPFIGFTKNEIIEYCVINNIPIQLTYSCELGLNQPCGKCLSCKGLKKIYDSKDINFKTPDRH